MIGAAPVELDDSLVEFQSQLSMIFARARSFWRESAAQIHVDLQPSGYKLLTFVGRAGSANAHQLAESFEMDKSVVSRQVRMLEELGLIQSRPDACDGRQRVLTVTGKGSEALARVRTEHAARMRAALNELTPEEVRTASKVFRVLAEV